MALEIEPTEFAAVDRPLHMTIEKFYETLDLIARLDTELSLQASIESIRDTLNQLVNAPAQPQFQANLASAIAKLAEATERLGATLTPLQSSAIAELRGEEFFDPSVSEKVKATISANAMTPSVARDFLTDLAARRAAYLATIRKTLEGLRNLGAKSEKLAPGFADMAFVIPRELFDNELDSFAKELSYINRLIQHQTEALTGTSEPVLLEGLSASVPTIALLAGVEVIANLAEIVESFLAAWERIEKIRNARKSITDLGLKGTAVEELNEEITSTINEVVEHSIDITLGNYSGDAGRKNELETALRQDTHRLFGQIERGLTIQFRAEPDPDADESDQSALETLERVNREMQFPLVDGEPVLLTSGQIIDGDIDAVRISQKTTTRKTTTTKKVATKTVHQNA